MRCLVLRLQLTTLLSEIGLNIQEAHAFSTLDGYSLDVFVVDGWAGQVFFFFILNLNTVAYLIENRLRRNWS